MWPLCGEDRGPVWGRKFCWFASLLQAVVAHLSGWLKPGYPILVLQQTIAPKRPLVPAQQRNQQAFEATATRVADASRLSRVSAQAVRRSATTIVDE
ncbi:hypothetical protein WQE_12686 [Paraburkholderia hospita]|jgi:hypothetical protein|uniref:Uncharacterized protein n=1 Tax=Paraburkholderia hospita TaxID=169430 RepID=A0ABP2PSD4_9BURK|nr:hypothetical protein WQE_12686 [Paraburkholderia hospita]